MTKSNHGGSFRNFVNTVMGVKTEDENPFIVKQKDSQKQLDLKALLIYILGTIVQIGIIILAFWGMEKLVILVENYDSLPNWLSTVFAGLFLTLLSIRSRIFSPLDNTRTSKTYDSIVKPKWAPPSAFSFSYSLDDNCSFTSYILFINLATDESTIFSVAFNHFCGTSCFRRYLEYNFYCRT